MGTFTVGSDLSGSGWSSYSGTPDTIYYVSKSQGSDSYNGLHPTFVSGTDGPFATIYKASETIYLNRATLNSTEVWVLIERGQVYDTCSLDPGVGDTLDQITISGISATRPHLWSNYDPATYNASAPVFNPTTGGDRPLIKTARARAGVYKLANLTGTMGNFCAFVGLDFYSYQRDPDNVADFIDTTNNVGGMGVGPVDAAGNDWELIEDCRVRFYSQALGIGTNTKVGAQLIIRRSSFLSSVMEDSQSQGIGGGAHVGLLMESVLVDHNGWHESVSTGRTHASAGRCHNIYIQGVTTDHDNGWRQVVTGGAGVYRNIISSRNCSGDKFSHGSYNDNFWVDNPIVCVLAQGIAGDYVISNNVAISATASTAGWGFQAIGWNNTDVSGGYENAGTSTIVNNIWAHSGGSNALILGRGTTGWTVSNNIIADWPNPGSLELNNGGILTFGTPTGGSGGSGAIPHYTTELTGGSDNSFSHNWNDSIYFYFPPSGQVYGNRLIGGDGTGVNGTYTGISLTGGHGSGAVATVIVGNDPNDNPGYVTDVRITTAGTGYWTDDVLTGSNANFPANWSVKVPPYCCELTAVSGHGADTEPTRAWGYIFVQNGAVTAVEVAIPGNTCNGKDYTTSSVVTAASVDIGGITGFSVPVASVSSNSSSGNNVTNGAVVDGNTYNGVVFPHPNRTLNDYAVSIGLANTAAFYTAARDNNKANWNSALTAGAVNDYIRAGFNLSEYTSSAFVHPLSYRLRLWA